MSSEESPPLTSRGRNYRMPQWRLPPGVAPGTWEYTQRESIANDYAAFLNNTPLISFDMKVVMQAITEAKADRSTRVIDFGCGDGRAMRHLWEAGYDVIGVDMSQSMLDRVINDKHGQAFAPRVIRANLVQLAGLASDIADNAICLFSTIGMICGRAHRQTFIREVFRITKPGGRFVLHVHNRNDAWRDRPSAQAYLKSAWRSVTSSKHELGDRTYAYRGLADMFLHTYSLNELKQDLRQARWHTTQIISLSPQSDGELTHARWLPSLRAGGYIAIAEKH